MSDRRKRVRRQAPLLAARLGERILPARAAIPRPDIQLTVGSFTLLERLEKTLRYARVYASVGALLALNTLAATWIPAGHATRIRLVETLASR